MNVVNLKTKKRAIARACKEIGFKFTGGVEGSRGWIGDVKTMLLDISRLKKPCWKPKLNSEEAVRKATQDLLKHSFLMSYSEISFLNFP